MTAIQSEALIRFWQRKRPGGWRYVTKTEADGAVQIIMRDTVGRKRVLRITPDGTTELEGIIC